MAGIPPELLSPLRQLLLRCGPFGSDQELRARFVDARLSPWRHRIPEGASPAERVQATIAMLANVETIAGQNGLVVLLRVLQEWEDPGDACHHQLGALADRLEEAFRDSPSPRSPDYPNIRNREPDSPHRGSGPAPQAPEAPPTEIRHRYALLIGVREVVDPGCRTLPHTVPDVVELAALLQTAGYTVRALHDEQAEATLIPTFSNIWGELENIAANTGPGDLLLVYFGGHGVLDHDGRAYLIPRDGRTASLRRTAIDLDEFKEALTGAGAQARVLILDACHAGIGRDGDGMAEAFAHHVYLTAEGTATLASCRRGQVAHEHHESHHGAFTHFILEGLRGAVQVDSYVTFDALADYVTAHVRQWATERGLQQWPNKTTAIAGNPALLVQPVARAAASGGILPPNPFTETLAVRDAARFVGRETELRRLRVLLEGGSVALMGQPKIGKSSLLWRLRQAWPGALIGPIDCYALEDQDDLYEHLSEALAQTASTWRQLRRTLHTVDALCLLDELDAGPQCGLTQGDLARFRAVCAANPHFRIVAVSRSSLKDIYPDTNQGSPPYNFLQPLTLGPLPDAEVRALLAHPWAPDAPAFDAATVDQLVALAEGHPFKAQRMAHHRYEALRDPAYDWLAAYRQDMEHML